MHRKNMAEIVCALPFTFYRLLMASPPVAEHISRFLKAKAAAVSGVCRADWGKKVSSSVLTSSPASSVFCPTVVFPPPLPGLSSVQAGGGMEAVKLL